MGRSKIVARMRIAGALSSFLSLASSSVIAIFVLSLLPTSSSLSVSELHGKYYEIFHRSGNRNAASHLWASYILDRSTSFTTEEIYNLFGGFCPISGSPVRPSAWSKWGSIPFKKASNTGQSTTGSVSVCCWPCVCDLQEFVKADTLEVDTRDGRTTFDVLVIGDPCVQPQRIPRRAPEVRCVDGRLEGATRSANDHVVIGLMQTGAESYYTADMVDGRCRARKQAGYRSGMGRIFVEVASINPIS